MGISSKGGQGSQWCVKAKNKYNERGHWISESHSGDYKSSMLWHVTLYDYFFISYNIKRLGRYMVCI